VQEENRGPTDTMGKTLKMQNADFSGLTDIQERFILPCNKLVKEIMASPKFLDGAESIEKIREVLELEKKDNSGVIPYRFAILDSYPQHIVLCYIPKASLVREFIKIKPSGFYFHEKFYTSGQQLVTWFKQNFKDPDYRKHVKRARSPKVLTQEEIQLRRARQAEERVNDY
jgi:hypothetical protein